jgi:hypothetical protein
MQELVLEGEEVGNAGVLLDLGPPFWVLWQGMSVRICGNRPTAGK